MSLKKAAIITSGFAPVPAVDNGAVERLTTNLIEENELLNFFDFDIYTIDDERLSNINLLNSTIIPVKLSKFEKFITRLVNWIIRKTKIRKNFLIYNYKLMGIIKKINKKTVYEYVILENSMDLIEQICNIFFDAKIVLHLHNDLNDISKTVEMGKIAIKNNVKIIAVSNYIKQSFLTKTGHEDYPCGVLYNCMDYEKKDIYEKVDYSRVRDKLGYHCDDFVLLFVGRLNDEKGIYELAQAFSEIDNSHIKLMVCGGTWGSDFVENRYTQMIYNVLGQRIVDVKFVGYIPEEDMYEYYAIANVVVIPSKVNEAFGMVMLEALLYGIPIIATKSGGMIEITDQESVVWIDKDKNIVNDLKQAIMYCYNNVKKMEYQATISQKKVLNRSEFNRKGYLERFIKLLE